MIQEEIDGVVADDKSQGVDCRKKVIHIEKSDQ